MGLSLAGGGRVKVTVCWLCWVMIVPMPVTAGPDGASASICQASDPLRPLDCDGFQLAPVADVHTATSCCPGGPNRPAAVKPAEPAALSAVKWCQVPVS